MESEVKWMQQKMVYTVKEMAQALDIGISKAYDLVRQNAVPNKKVGKRILIPREALLVWLNGSLEERYER
jgi:excisionase family DNA binding protein